ncbi:MAG: (deoxy)nucleoside triphosphate pyrophosphohydrolase [Deltaproteobacteria bacterium]|nr:(deoxy)nucleoside triphosphate pyrophosphohydrolase [Deltaproteobacteria bacterium]
MSRWHVRVVGAMVEQPGGRYLITQRPETASLPLLWEFPGGRVEAGETDEAALARELRELLGIDVSVGRLAVHSHHAYPDYDVDLRVFHCSLSGAGGEIRHLRVRDHRWVRLEEMSSYEFPKADAKTLGTLLGLES